MNRELLNKINEKLKVLIKEKYLLEPYDVDQLSHVGQLSFQESIKKFVLKNGTTEIEQMMFKQLNSDKSELVKQAKTELLKGIKEKNILDNEKSEDLANFSCDFLIQEIIKEFNETNHPKNTDGIADFLGIDSNLLKLVNSPSAKFFGKFF